MDLRFDPLNLPASHCAERAFVEQGFFSQSQNPKLNLSDAQRTTTRSSTEIAYLPNQTRNPQGLVFLEPAVTPMYSPRGQNASLVAISGAQTGQIAAYGGGGRATAYSLDYTDTNDWEFGGFALGTQPSIDMIAEFKVLTGVFPAEFGLESSNVVAITKSGTNTLHGELYDFVENDALDARDYSIPRARQHPSSKTSMVSIWVVRYGAITRFSSAVTKRQRHAVQAPSFLSSFRTRMRWHWHWHWHWQQIPSRSNYCRHFCPRFLSRPHPIRPL